MQLNHELGTNKLTLSRNHRILDETGEFRDAKRTAIKFAAQPVQIHNRRKNYNRIKGYVEEKPTSERYILVQVPKTQIRKKALLTE